MKVNKSTKKHALESTEKKNEDAFVIAAIQVNNWCNISNTKRNRSMITSVGCQLLEFRKFGDDGLPTESGIVFNEEEIKNLIQLIPAFDRNFESALFIRENIDFKKNLGRNKFVTINSNYLRVDFRVFKVKGSTKLHASKRGLAFNLVEFRKLKNVLYMMELALQMPDLSEYE